MTRLFTAMDMAQELGVSRPQLSYWLKRFNAWLPETSVNGRQGYSMDVLSTLMTIAEMIQGGSLPSEIDALLAAGSKPQPDRAHEQTDMVNIPGPSGSPAHDPMKLLESLLSTMESHQERIARAQERRAEAEERKVQAIEKRAKAEEIKARAIEKRAEAEEKKAMAMDRIASALQNMRHEVFPGTGLDRIAMESAKAVALDDSADQGDDDAIDVLEEAPPSVDILGMPEEDEPDLDDLAKLLEPDSAPDDEPMDDLAELLDPQDRIQATGDPDMDDLAKLLEPDSDQDDEPMDDLAQLLDPQDRIQATGDTDMDDLATLLEPDSAPDDEPMDDLAQLLDPQDRIQATGDPDMDDLAKLLEPDSAPDDEPMDDLAQLLDPKDRTQTTGDPGMDDLTKLLEPDSIVTDAHPAGEPVKQPAVTDEQTSETTVSGSPRKAPDQIRINRPTNAPDTNMEGYKTEIINIIIDLKKKGLSVEQTTRRFNDEAIQTLSGRKQWTAKAMGQIYSLIDAASA